MNAGLRYLLRAELRGAFRRWRARFRGTRGALLAIGFAFVLAVILLPRLVRLFTQGRRVPGLEEPAFPAPSGAEAPWGAPIALLAALLFGLSSRALYFKPPEVGFLFPAPVSRRALLVYHLLSRSRVHVLSALWISLFVYDVAGSWSAGFFGSFLFFTFLGLVSGLSGLLFAALNEAAGRRVRRVALALAVAGGAWILVQGMSSDGSRIVQHLEGLAEHDLVQAVSWITRPFVEVFTARETRSMLAWALVSAGVLALAFLLLVAFDVAYEEAALRTSQRVDERLSRLRRGGTASLAAAPRPSRWRPPALPFWGGAGPIAWRQSIEMVRNARSILWLLVLGLAMSFFLVWMRSGSQTSNDDNRHFVAVLTLVFVLSFSQNLAFDFRRDLDRLGWWKTVPVHAVAIAAGQVLGTAFLTVWVLSTALAGLTVLGALAPRDLLWILPPLVPLAWLFAAIDNALFLLLPYRIQPRDSNAPPAAVRVFFQMLAKFGILGLIALVGAGLGAVIHLLFSPPAWVFVFAATVYLALACLPLTWFVGRVFARFDVARADVF